MLSATRRKGNNATVILVAARRGVFGSGYITWMMQNYGKFRCAHRVRVAGIQSIYDSSRHTVRLSTPGRTLLHPSSNLSFVNVSQILWCQVTLVDTPLQIPCHVTQPKNTIALSCRRRVCGRVFVWRHNDTPAHKPSIKLSPLRIVILSYCTRLRNLLRRG